MQFNHSNKTRLLSSKKDKSEIKCRHDGYLHFYDKLPEDSITLQEFEDQALERLKVLKALELVSLTQARGSEDYKDCLNNRFNELGWKFLHNKNLLDVDDTKDLISHLTLRLAYCRTEAQRQWFVTQEAELLRYRMDTHPSTLDSLLRLNEINSDPISKETFLELKDELVSCDHVNRLLKHSTRMLEEKFYKVDFREILQLISTRRVYLNDGFAYLPESELKVLVINKYKEHLKGHLAKAYRQLPAMEEDNRILKQLKALSDGDIGGRFSSHRSTEGLITADMLDELSKQSFPLCMQQLHNHLISKHHMKHQGRMQYGLFLKGIGLSLEESLKYWKREFTKGGLDPEKFDKNYAYNIRHNYGKEGKRTDYTPHSCMKIISCAEPAGDECHGCPFKHNDDASVRQQLDRMKISQDAIESVIGLKKQGHYQIACTRVFNATHKQEGLQSGLQHPNQYFDESRTLVTGASNETANHYKDRKSLPQTIEEKTTLVDNKENQTNEDIFADEIEFDDMM